MEKITQGSAYEDPALGVMNSITKHETIDGPGNLSPGLLEILSDKCHLLMMAINNLCRPDCR